MIADWEKGIHDGWIRHFQRAVGRRSVPYEDEEERQQYRDVMVSF